MCIQIACFSNISKSILHKLGLPEPPKKPANGYRRFTKENFETFRKTSKSRFDIFTNIGAQWKILPEVEKEKYNNEYKKENVCQHLWTFLRCRISFKMNTTITNLF